MDILTSVIQFSALTVGIVYLSSIAIKAYQKAEAISTDMLYILGFSWATFIYVTFLM